VQTNNIQVLASADIAPDGVPENVQIVPLAPWLERGSVIWSGPLPLCAFVAEADRAGFQGSALAVFLQASAVPVVYGAGAGMGAEICQQLMRAMESQQQAAAVLRAEQAALRQDFMRLQQSFAATEDFLNAAFAPTFTCARAWEPAEGEVSGSIEQRLPVGSIGLVAVDIWAMGAGHGTLRFARLTGADFGEAITLEAKGAGWVRAMLPTPLAGLAEDVVIRVEADFALGLSLPIPLDYMHATGAAAPLALRAWKGLPGCRIAEMEPRGTRYVLPASALPTPEVQGGTAKLMPGRDAFSLHPGHDGKMDFVFRGIEVPRPANVAAYTQNFGPEPVTLSLASTAEEVARRNMLPPESHVQIDMFVTEAGKVDMHFKLRAASPLVSVFLRGVEVIPFED
jgi:NAD(P)-dependent dehydrogenase (short-subunit alcohol dehydrogenase family)